jgi:hypothetical protein
VLQAAAAVLLLRGTGLAVVLLLPLLLLQTDWAAGGFLRHSSGSEAVQ